MKKLTVILFVVIALGTALLTKNLGARESRVAYDVTKATQMFCYGEWVKYFEGLIGFDRISCRCQNECYAALKNVEVSLDEVIDEGDGLPDGSSINLSETINSLYNDCLNFESYCKSKNSPISEADIDNENSESEQPEIPECAGTPDCCRK